MNPCIACYLQKETPEEGEIEQEADQKMSGDTFIFGSRTVRPGPQVT